MDPNSYRPVSLLNTISKIFEKIIYHRIMYFLKTCNALHKNQFGFIENVSATDCLTKVTGEIARRKYLYKYTAVISIDFKSAFDSADWQQIIDSFALYNVPKYIVNIVNSYLCNRFVYADRLENKVMIGKGCPQGSCFGPLFWTLLVNDILWSFDREDCTLVAYADDFLLLVSDNTRNALEQKVNYMLNKFFVLSTSHKLVISFDKTVGMIVGKSMDQRNPIFEINDKKIKIVKIFKYLGVNLDNKFTFIPHIHGIKEDILKLSMGVNRVRGANWGVSSELLKIWYILLIQSRLLYGVPAWYP